MEDLISEITELVREVDSKKNELFKRYLMETKDSFMESEYDDFNEYEENELTVNVYNALNLGVLMIDDFFDNSYHKEFVLMANKEKELGKMSEMEKEILSITPSIDKCELFKIVKYINSRLED